MAGDQTESAAGSCDWPANCLFPDCGCPAAYGQPPMGPNPHPAVEALHQPHVAPFRTPPVTQQPTPYAARPRTVDPQESALSTGLSTGFPQGCTPSTTQPLGRMVGA